MNSHALDCSNLDSWSEMMLFSLHMKQKSPQNKGCCWFKRRWTSTLLVLWWCKHADLHLPLIFYFSGCFGFEDDTREGSEFPLLSCHWYWLLHWAISNHQHLL